MKPPLLFVILLLLTLSACNSGSGNGNSVSFDLQHKTLTFTHNELADLFRKFLASQGVFGDENTNTLLAKSSTSQSNYIVLKTFSLGEWEYSPDYNLCEDDFCRIINSSQPHINEHYYAVNLSSWIPQLPGVNGGVAPFQYLKDANNFERVLPDGYSAFKGLESGLIFQKTSATPKNLARIRAIQEAVLIRIGTNELRLKYGLSTEKAEDLARFSYRIRKNPPGTFRVADFDQFSKELIGSSISDFQIDFAEKNSASLAKRLQLAREMTGIGIEGVNMFIQEAMRSR